MDNKSCSSANRVAIWGGLECTINRVGDNYRDQLADSGHYLREGDIGKFAKLGITALRYPILWERHQPVENDPINWEWTNRQLEKIRACNIQPVACLLHHGSGPIFTNLAEKNFAKKLACYAGKVATRFPWIEYYTPVNEPLTTARFSGLYGHWYPHHRDDRSFVRMLINEVKAIVLSMQAIRKINPLAKLVQTEDLSLIHSTPLLKYQADFENERRWLTYDLLCAKVNSAHHLWDYLIDHGITETELLFFLKNSCPPAVVGLNYYVTSERYLDERVDKYPPHTHGGNGKHSYADTEAVRGHGIKLAGLKALVKKVWARYHLPIAMTEVHLGCSREQQMRWFMQTWQICKSLKEENIDIRAVTAWSLLGSFDWNSLITRNEKKYEVGVFDISNGRFRATGMAGMLKSLARTGDCNHPVLSGKGWWEMPSVTTAEKQVLICGKTGTLGSAFSRISKQRGIACIALDRSELDICSPDDIENAIEKYKPWAIINATGYVRVDEAEMDIKNCFDANDLGPFLLATSARKHSIPFVNFSSDLVFSGHKGSAYMEIDAVDPVNVYGLSKAAGEQSVLGADPAALVIRTSAFFGPWDQHNYAFNILKTLEQQEFCYAVNDVMVSPTYVPDLVHASLDLLIDGASGIWHLSNRGILSWSDFAREVAGRGGYPKEKIIEKSIFEMNWKAVRPAYSALATGKGLCLPPITDALQRYFEEKHEN